MTHHNAILSIIITTPLLFTGCSKEEEAPPPPPPAPVVTGPTWTLSDISIDPRVQFPERYAPAEQAVAQAIADLAAGIINGQASEVRSSLESDKATALDILVAQGQWESATQQGRLIRVVNLEENEGNIFVALGWEGANTAFPIAFRTNGMGSPVRFAPLAIQERFESRAAALDGIPFDPPSFDAASGPTTSANEDSNAPAQPDNDGDNSPDRGAPSPSPGFGG